MNFRLATYIEKAKLGFAFLSLAALMIAIEPIQVQASGGILRNGETLTIGSSGLQLQLNPLSQNDLPELLLAGQVVRKLTMPTELVGGLLKELRPSSTRKYFRVNRISVEEEKALVAAYRDLLPELPSSDRLTLFALTDSQKRETYLLPAFFNLSAKEQRAAVLFHESLRSGGFTSYQTIVGAEGAMESLLKCNGSCIDQIEELQARLSAAYDQKTQEQITLMRFQQAALWDAQNGQLTGILNTNGELNIAAFLGPDLFRMLTADFDRSIGTEFSQFPANYREARLGELAEKWPNSKTIKVLLSTELNLTFVKFNRFYKSVYDLNHDGPALGDNRVTAITEWNYSTLNIQLAQKPVTYEPEVFAYWLKGGDEERSSFYSTKDLFSGVQSIDISLSTKMRKAYAKLVREKRDRWNEDDNRGGTYYYYLFGFTFL